MEDQQFVQGLWSSQLFPLDCYNQFHVFRSISFRSENYILYFAERFRGLNQSYQQQCRSTEVRIIAGKSWSSFNGRYIQAQTKERTKHEEKPPDNGMFNLTPSSYKKKKIGYVYQVKPAKVSRKLNCAIIAAKIRSLIVNPLFQWDSNQRSNCFSSKEIHIIRETLCS